MAVWMSRSGEPTTLDNTVLAATVAGRTTTLNAATAPTALGSFLVVAVAAAVIAGVLVWRTRNLQVASTLAQRCARRLVTVAGAASALSSSADLTAGFDAEVVRQARCRPGAYRGGCHRSGTAVEATALILRVKAP
jgi:hypothetical protein